MKTCRDCQQTKPLEEFPRDKRTRSGRYSYCYVCHRRRRKEWASEHPDKKRATARRQWLKVLYGVTPEMYDAMLVEQGGRCAICGGEGKCIRKDMRFALHIDHDHATGVIRGLLCHRCNTLLGNAGDDVSVLLRAIEYLRKHH